MGKGFVTAAPAPERTRYHGTIVADRATYRGAPVFARFRRMQS